MGCDQVLEPQTPVSVPAAQKGTWLPSSLCHCHGKLMMPSKY